MNNSYVFGTGMISLFLILPILLLAVNGLGTTMTGFESEIPMEGKEGNSGPFMENCGQWASDDKFVARTSFGHVAIGDDYIIYNLIEFPEEGIPSPDRDDFLEFFRDEGKDQLLSGSVIRIDFEGSAGGSPVGSSLVGENNNFMLGNDPENWRSGIRSFETVKLNEVWNDIDIVFSTSNGCLKYDVVLGPKADPANIIFHVEGHSGITSEGDTLIIDTPINMPIMDTGLVALVPGTNEVVHSSFEIIDNDRYCFSLGDYDRAKGLVIDPIVFSTFYGGNAVDSVTAQAMDSNDNIYLAGYTMSTNFPTSTGAYQTTIAGLVNCVVVKLSSDGTSTIFSTYVGGNDVDGGLGLTIDERNNVLVTGVTYSKDFPVTSGCYNDTHWGTTDYADIFVLELNPTGTSLTYSTYVAGSDDDGGMDIIETSSGPYVLGSSYSDNFPTTSGAYDTTHNDLSDIVIFKLSSDLSTLSYSTFIGGSDDETGLAFEMDGSNNLYITGSTYSSDFPTTSGAYDTTYSDWTDVVVLKFGITSNSLAYSTYIGGDDEEEGMDIQIDPSGNAYVVGYTWDGTRDTFPTTTGAYDTTYNGGSTDIFALKLNSGGTSLVYSTYIGGSDDEEGYSLDLDADLNAYITGNTWSTNYPTTLGALYTTFQGGDIDAIVSVLDNTGSSLTYSTFLGGNSDDYGYCMDLSENKEAVVSGDTDSSNFPTTTGVVQPTLAGMTNYFISRINFTSPPSAPRNLMATSGEDFIDLAWMAPLSLGGSTLTHYNIFKGTSSGPTEIIDNVTTLNYHDTDISVGEVYYYTVAAATQAYPLGNLKSNEVNSMVTSISSSPRSLNAHGGNKEIRLSWEAPEFNGGLARDHYNLYIGTESGSLSLKGTIPQALTEYLVIDLDIGMKYYFELTAVNSKGESDPSNEATNSTWPLPDAPTELEVVSGDGYVHISWTKPVETMDSPITGFRIYRGEGDTEKITLATLGSSTTNYNDTDVTNGVTYTYNISAITVVGESPMSLSVQGLPLAKPSSPLSLALETGDEYINVSWMAPLSDGGSSIESYIILNGSTDDGLIQLGVIPASTMYFNHTGLTNGIEMFYAVIAVNTVGESAISTIVSGIPLGLPEPPEDLAAVAGNGYVMITWEAPLDTGGLDIVGFKIYRGNATDNVVMIEEITSPDDLEFNDTDVENGVTYYYKVSAETNLGESELSPEIEALPLGTPGLPFDLILTPGDGSVTIGWSAPLVNGGADILKYTIYKAVGEGDFQVLTEPIGTTIEYVDEDVGNGLTYKYYISASNSIGESAPSEILSTTPVGIPGAPKNINAAVSDGGILVSWEAPDETGGSAITKYEVYRSTNGGDFELIVSLTSSDLSHLDTTALEGVSYIYKVSTGTDVGSSEGTSSQSIMIEVEKSGSDDDFPIIVIIIPVAIVLLVIIALVLFLVLRKKKGDDEATVTEEPSVEGTYPPQGQVDAGMLQGQLQPQLDQTPQQSLNPAAQPQTEAYQPPQQQEVTQYQPTQQVPQYHQPQQTYQPIQQPVQEQPMVEDQQIVQQEPQGEIDPVQTEEHIEETTQVEEPLAQPPLPPQPPY